MGEWHCEANREGGWGVYWGVLGNLQSEGGLGAQRADSRNVWEKIRLFYIYGCSYNRKTTVIRWSVVLPIFSRRKPGYRERGAKRGRASRKGGGWEGGELVGAQSVLSAG